MRETQERIAKLMTRRANAVRLRRRSERMADKYDDQIINIDALIRRINKSNNK